MQLASELIQNEMIGRVAYPLAVVFSIHLVLATSVVSWFHGARGRQKVETLEVVLLVALGLTWLASSGWIVAF